MFKRVLIANRGEIAIRIARAAAGLGIESVSIFAPADALGLHTRVSTESRAIGVPGGDPVAAYLDAGALVAVAVESGCDCVHPGYGFLSESAAFAGACQAAGLTFIGPGPEALALFGDKVAARDLARSEGVPTVPGSEGALESAEIAASVAATLGYPVMLKAAAGGGGRGMRLVVGAGEMAEALRVAEARPRRRSATARSSLKRRSSGPGISRCRCWPTPSATLFIFGSATVRCSFATRK